MAVVCLRLKLHHLRASHTHLDIFASTHGLESKIVCFQSFSDGVLNSHLDIVGVLV